MAEGGSVAASLPGPVRRDATSATLRFELCGEQLRGVAPVPRTDSTRNSLVSLGVRAEVDRFALHGGHRRGCGGVFSLLGIGRNPGTVGHGPPLAGGQTGSVEAPRA
jgi:hypothetical protein